MGCRQEALCRLCILKTVVGERWVCCKACFAGVARVCLCVCVSPSRLSRTHLFVSKTFSGAGPEIPPLATPEARAAFLLAVLLQKKMEEDGSHQASPADWLRVGRAVEALGKHAACSEHAVYLPKFVKAFPALQDRSHEFTATVRKHGDVFIVVVPKKLFRQLLGPDSGRFNLKDVNRGLKNLPRGVQQARSSLHRHDRRYQLRSTG